MDDQVCPIHNVVMLPEYEDLNTWPPQDVLIGLYCPVCAAEPVDTVGDSLRRLSIQSNSQPSINQKRERRACLA